MGAKNLELQLVEYALAGKKTGLKLVDNLITDALEEKRMATEAELACLKMPVKANLNQLDLDELKEFELFLKVA